MIRYASLIALFFLSSVPLEELLYPGQGFSLSKSAYLHGLHQNECILEYNDGKLVHPAVSI